ncbi:hypothetical protein [Botryobacter ruber]|uniref:hypothetical protein n=1 Tax=Botryobacter ruber TaxID=2171629 RepID=UPI000E0BD9DB|nr:hypothetical protein [Botryobacter ruber]
MKNRKRIPFLLGLVVVLLLLSCKRVSDLKAFSEASYALQGVSNATVNGIDLMDKYGPDDFTPGQGDSLLAAIYTNKLCFSATLYLDVQMQEPGVAREMTMTSLKWKLWVDGSEALLGEVKEPMKLTDGANELPVSTTILMAEKDGLPNYEGLSKLVTLLGKRQDMRRHLTFLIKPTIRTPLGNVELPEYIKVAQPAAPVAASSFN